MSAARHQTKCPSNTISIAGSSDKSQCRTGFLMDVYDASALSEISTMPDTSSLPLLGAGVVPTIDFPDEAGAAAFRAVVPKTPDQLFAARWTGCFRIGNAGLYTFCAYSDDGSFLYVDGVLAADNGGVHPAGQTCGAPVHLKAGIHALRVDFFENFGNTAMRALYTGHDTGNQLRLIKAV